jgi:hypothetical protein
MGGLYQFFSKGMRFFFCSGTQPQRLADPQIAQTIRSGANLPATRTVPSRPATLASSGYDGSTR